MSRLRTDNVFGTITDSPLTNVAGAVNSAGLANLPVVASPDYAVITLDPNRVHGAPEIIYVITHTGSATSATILRGREGTVARQHPAGTFWVHAPTARDLALGELGYGAAGSTNQNVTTVVAVTGATATFTAAADRRVKVTGQINWSPGAAADAIELRIMEGGTTLKLAQETGETIGRGYIFPIMHVLTPTAGAHTYFLDVSRVAGAGTDTVLNSSNRSAFILVEDIGPVRTVQPT